MEFLKANGIEDHSFVKEMDYQEVLNSQEIFGDELQMFAKKEMQKEVGISFKFIYVFPFYNSVFVLFCFSEFTNVNFIVLWIFVKLIFNYIYVSL